MRIRQQLQAGGFVMELVVYAITAVLLLVAGYVVFRFFVHRDYRDRGRLSPFSSFLQLLLFFLHGTSAYVYMDVTFRRIRTDSPLFIPAMVCIVVGLVLMLIAMSRLGAGQVFGVKVTGLRQSGLYRYTRNPQIVFGLPIYIGFAMLWPAWTGLVWLGLLWVLLHMMVLTEEEHLRRAFGEEYDRYRAKTPRYLGFRRR